MKINVIGSGIWGACTAYFLQKEGAEVELYDMWGPGNARSGSGGASRIIRLSYGDDKIYTDLTNKSFKFWENLSNESDRELYNENGMLWMVSQNDSSYITNSAKHIERCGHSLKEISINKVKKMYPKINFEDINQVFFEKKAGALMASRCCKNVVRKYQKNGGKINIGEVKINEEELDKNNSITYNGKNLNADYFVIACGPWNRKLLPNFLEKITYTSRQEVYYFSVPNSCAKDYNLQNMPCWLDLNANNPSYYGIPFHLNKGFKIAYDERTTLFDPDTSDRIPKPELVKRVKEYCYRRFPKLSGLPISETRVCQYENSLDGDFIINKHHKNKKIIVLSGSSGHGFKMGPGIGEMVSDVILKNKKIPTLFNKSRLDKKETSSQYYSNQIKYKKNKRLFN